MGTSWGTLVVGGSVAAVTAASELRRLGYDERIVLISDESRPPYARPPLSKGVLAGGDSVESVTLPPFGDDVEVRLAARADSLDLTRRRVRLADGDELPFDSLLIATGARARTLGLEEATGEHVLRTLDDCLDLRDRLVRASSVVVVGGGLLGMEFASTCQQLGVRVTLVDLGPPLVRQLGPFLAYVLVGAALDAGVKIQDAPGGVNLLGSEDRLGGVQLKDGSRFEADLVLTAIGCRPNSEWLASSGLNLSGGVVVDEFCRAAPGVMAAGDVAAWAHARGEPRRTPHYMHAVDQARAAAATIALGSSAQPYRPSPYFWTEQFGLAVKVCGPLPLTGVPRLVEGSLRDQAAVLCWEDRGVPVAAATINHRMPLKRLRELAGS